MPVPPRRDGLDSSPLMPWKSKAKDLRNEVHAICLACKDPRTPWYAKALGVFIIGYALSPIDLIPDFIPVLGYLDDLILVTAGIALLLGIIPREVIEESRGKVRSQSSVRQPQNWIAGMLIVLIWILAICVIARLIWRIFL